jgi:hypothetical protein
MWDVGERARHVGGEGWSWEGSRRHDCFNEYDCTEF